MSPWKWMGNPLGQREFRKLLAPAYWSSRVIRAGLSYTIKLIQSSCQIMREAVKFILQREASIINW
jgi:hypothetical protein